MVGNDTEILKDEDEVFVEFEEKTLTGGTNLLTGDAFLLENGTLIDEKAIQAAHLSDEEEAELSSLGFSDRKVLVGSVRTEAQYLHCKHHRYYYFPAKGIRKEDLIVSSIAIYRPKRLGNAGVTDVGKILRIIRLPRFLVPFSASKNNPLERYYAVAVDEFTTLAHPIAARGVGVNEPRFTTEFQLRHARESYELFAIANEEEYRLHAELWKILTEVDFCDDGSALPRKVGDRLTVFCRDRKFSVSAKDRSTYVRFPAEEFERYPHRIMALLHEYLTR